MPKPKVKILDVTSEREMIPIKLGPERVPDPAWSFVDSNGEKHEWAGDELPTLKQRKARTYYCQLCEEDHDEFEWFVPATDEVVEPGYVWKSPRKDFIAGTITTHGTFQQIAGEISPGDVLTAAEVEWPEGIDHTSELVGSIEIDLIMWDGETSGQWHAVAPGWGT